MTNRLRDILSSPRRVSGKKIGVEIELEYTRPVLFTYNTIPWSIKTDGSLRGYGYEFVSEPLDKQSVGNAIKEFTKILSDSKAQDPVFSGRAGTHIHFNMQHKTPEDILKSIVRMAVMDGVITRISGKGRFNNQFCLPYETCPKNINKIIYNTILGRGNSSKQLRHFMNINRSNVKYSSINIGTLNSFGTLEQRSFKSTIDPTELQDYISILFDIVYNDPIKKDTVTKEYVEEYASYCRVNYSSLLPNNAASKYISNNEDMLYDAVHFAEYYNQRPKD